MNEPFQLVTNCTFKGKDYLVQMCVLNSKKLQLTITDKLMGEDWQCEYDASYIEALTHKTGNFKQFDVFVMMLKSGLLKTSDCITLDLLTVEDLEQLRCKKFINAQSSSRTSQTVHLNKRYLILTYSVEFDRIHYPLPLDYCGPPDPIILQNNIRKLENEVERLKQKNNHLSRNEVGETKKLKEKIQNLLEDNSFLTNEVHRLNKLLAKRSKPMKINQGLLNSLKKLEEQVLHEKNTNHRLIFKLKAENKQLAEQVENLKKSEKSLKAKLNDGSRHKLLEEYKRSSRSRQNLGSSLERKLNENFDCQPPLPSFSGKDSSLNKPRVRPLRKLQNRFLTSSSSESESKRPHRPRSREKKELLSQRQRSNSDPCRKSSNDRSRLNSVDSKRSIQQRPKTRAKCSTSKEVKVSSQIVQSQSGCCTRDSSLSSRASSRRSRLSNTGSGDCSAAKSKRTPRSIIDTKEDLRFSMSDIETRIHALQKLLSEGLNF